MQTRIAQRNRHQSQMRDASNVLEWGKNRLEGREIELKNILRWEDDGGRLNTVEEFEAMSSDYRRLI
jgi:hypothetical protein